MQPVRQAKLAKQCGHLSLAASIAASSPDEATASSCHMQGWHAPKLAGHRRDAVVARSNASMVGQGDHLGTMPNGCHDRCFKFRLGRLVETIQPLRPAQGRGTRLLATDRRRNEQRCSGALRCKINSHGSHAIASRPSSARRDRRRGNPRVYQPSRWSIPVLKQHCSGSVVDVLPCRYPPRRSTSTSEGECPSRLTVSLEA